MGKKTSQVPISRIRSIRDWQWNRETRDTVCVEPCVPQSDFSKRLLMGDRIGKGGMCVIEEAFDANLLTRLARKTILPEFAGDERTSGTLVEEAQITAQLDHPHIVPVHELGIDDHGRLYFTMKLVKGRTLTEVLKESDYRTRTARELFAELQILLKVCDAVAFAHSRGVIHRDLKPDNIMVGDFGEVYLMDWGLALLKKKKRPSMNASSGQTMPGRRRYASLEEKGMVNGTILYIAPEQAKGAIETIDERTDVFGLGAILYEILTELPPYASDSVEKIIEKALRGDIIPPQDAVTIDLPTRLCHIAMQAMHPDPERRFPSALEFKRSVENFLQSGWQFERQVFPAKTLIVREGEPGDRAYIITLGHCRAFKTIDGRKVLLEEMGVGDVFGEIAVFTDQPRSASVEALDQVTTMVITRRNFEEDLGMTFWLGLFAKALGERLIEADRRIIELERLVRSETVMRK